MIKPGIVRLVLLLLQRRVMAQMIVMTFQKALPNPQRKAMQVSVSLMDLVSSLIKLVASRDSMRRVRLKMSPRSRALKEVMQSPI